MPKKPLALKKGPATPLSHLPTVMLSPRGVARLKSGHPWVYRSDITTAENVLPGAMVRVVDQRGKFLGTALYSSSSQIAIRMISREEVSDLPALVAERIRAALGYRAQFVADTDAYRVVFSEADFLPGLIIDRYNDVLSVQILTQAMDADAVRGAVVATLVEELRPAGIVERVDPRIRELEQLPPRQSAMLWGDKSATIVTMNRAVERADDSSAHGNPPQPRGGDSAGSPASPILARWGAMQPTAQAVGSESEQSQTPEGRKKRRDPVPESRLVQGVRFHYDALEGQKTGAFLDQRENYAAAARYARGRALDVFCYQGGFALHLAAGSPEPRCSSVTGVDTSRPALEMAEKNAALNFPGREFEWIEANAFDLLRDYAAAGRRYDTVVLDPPAFAKSKRDLDKARSGYKELNLRALKMLAPGGILVTCSCSFHVSAADFLEVLAAAARDAHKSLRILETRGASRDHPMLLNVPETAYLKCMIFNVSN